ncbi:MAG: glycosyltransferase family 87 protein [Candidatus Dormibacteraceae bacterium]
MLFDRMGQLFSLKGVISGLIAALALETFHTLQVLNHNPSLFTDFDIYWAAGWLVDHGRNPYDLPALTQVIHSVGSHAWPAQGYSYPLFFILLMAPLGLLPLTWAETIFSVLSVVALVPAVAMLIAWLERQSNQPSWGEVILLAILIGALIPVTGSLDVGQVNLLLLPLLVLAFVEVAPGPLIAIVGAVKLYPILALATFFPRGKSGWQQIGVGGGLFVLLAILPNILLHLGGNTLKALFIPDGYWTNQSINGFISRLVPTPGIFPASPLPLPSNFPTTPVMLLVTALLGCLVLAVIVIVRGRPWDGCMALLLTYGCIAAPHNSLWNFTPLVISGIWCWYKVRKHPLARVLVVSWVLVEMQCSISQRSPNYHFPIAWPLNSLALYGALMLGILQVGLILCSRRAVMAVE